MHLTCLWHYYTHSEDLCGCVHWHTGWEHCVNTHAYNPAVSRTIKLPHRFSMLFCPFLFFRFCERKKPLGHCLCLYLAAAVFFFVVTSPTVSPSYFMKSFCQAGNPAVLHYSYSAMETGESEVPTTTLMTCKDGVKTLQRLHLLSPVLSQLLWSWSWRQES